MYSKTQNLNYLLTLSLNICYIYLYIYSPSSPSLTCITSTVCLLIVLAFTWIISFKLHKDFQNKYKWGSFYWWRNWDSERLNKLLKVLSLVTIRTGIWIFFLLLSNMSNMLLITCISDLEGREYVLHLFGIFPR